MIPYADLIELNEPYEPVTGPADLESVVDLLVQDPALVSFTTQYDLPKDPKRKRQWVQAALTLRAPGLLPANLVEAMDRLLQEELARKDITDAAELPRLNTAYPISDKVSIWNGDIATLKIDAITNAANAQMLGCFQPFHACIDNVIQCAAGPQLREDCHKVMIAQGHDEPTGSAKITRAYNLPSRFVLHTVGPIVPDYRPSAAQARQLAQCYLSCLDLACEVGVRSIAFCGISTGVFGYPADQAATIALRTAANWMQEHPRALDHIVFNTFGEAATDIYNEAVESWT